VGKPTCGGIAIFARLASIHPQIREESQIYETSDSENLDKAMALKSIGDLTTPEAREFVSRVKRSKDYNNEFIREVADLYP
jgi:hypothetical protein